MIEGWRKARIKCGKNHSRHCYFFLVLLYMWSSMHAYEETTQPLPSDLHFSISDNSAALNQGKYCEKNKTTPRTTTITTTAATKTMTSSSSSTSSSSTTTTATSSTTTKELKKKRSRGFSYYTCYQLFSYLSLKASLAKTHTRSSLTTSQVVLGKIPLLVWWNTGLYRPRR